MVRVVLLEQDEVMQAFLSQYLTRKGYQVDTESPHHLQPGRIERKVPELLIAHVRGAADRDWLSLAAGAARELGIPVLAIVAVVRRDLKELCEVFDAYATLVMPFGGSELEKAIRALLGREEGVEAAPPPVKRHPLL